MTPFWRKKNKIRSTEPPLILDIAGPIMLLAQTVLPTRPEERPVVLRCFEAPTPPDHDSEPLQDWLEQQHLHNLPAHLLLGLSEYQVQVAELPQVPPEELRDALRWRLTDIFNLAIEEEISFDFQTLPAQGFNPMSTQGLVFAIDNTLLRRRQLWLRGAGLGLNVVDTREMAQRNLSALAEADERGLAVLSITEHGGLLTVTQNGTLYLSRRLELSLNSLDTPDAQRKTDLIERSALDIQRSLDIFDRQYSSLGLSRLLIAPMPGQEHFISDLSQNLYIPVAAYELGDMLDLSAVEQREQPRFLAAAWGALGASLRPAEESVA